LSLQQQQYLSVAIPKMLPPFFFKISVFTAHIIQDSDSPFHLLDTLDSTCGTQTQHHVSFSLFRMNTTHHNLQSISAKQQIANATHCSNLQLLRLREASIL
jgi:hypothetical protein